MRNPRHGFYRNGRRNAVVVRELGNALFQKVGAKPIVESTQELKPGIGEDVQES